MNKALKQNPFGTAAVVIALLALGFSGYSALNSSSKLSTLGEQLGLVDEQVDKWEGKIAGLKEEGYVEIDDFGVMSERAVDATVHLSAVNETEGNPQGSGFFVSADGIIVTANHVVEGIGEENIKVRSVFGETPAKVLVRDAASDIAILETGERETPFLSLGYFANFDVGDEIGFVGYTLGVAEPLVHQGVVSTKALAPESGLKSFTVNAFVNKGMSGGPVFSATTGRVLGVLSARKKDETSEQFISLPEDYKGGITLGSVDPLKLSVDLYNQSVQVVSEVAQVGIGVVSAADNIRTLVE